MESLERSIDFKEMYSELIAALNGMFYSGLLVEPERDKVFIFQSRDWKEMEGKETSWTDYLARYAAIFSEEDRRGIEQKLSCISLKEAAERGTKPYILNYPYKIHGKQDQVSMFVMPKKNAAGEAEAYIFVRHSNEDLMRRRIIDLYVYDNFDFFIYLDAKTNSYEMFSGNKDGATALPKVCKDYSSLVTEYTMDYVVPEDREMVIREMQTERVIEQLDRHGVHSFYFGIMDEDHNYLRKQLSYRYYDREAGRILMTRTDVTGIYLEERARQRELRKARLGAETDTLTGLCNYGGTKRRITGMLEGNGDGAALLFLDLDNFKAVNDRFGHLVGDELLKKTAKVLKMQTGESDIQGRVGGDEFVLYLSGIKDRSQVELRAQRICEAVSRIALPEKGVPTITCSIGIAMAPYEGKNYDTLVKAADRRAYEAKARGKNRYM